MKPDCKKRTIVKWLNLKILEFVQMHWMESFAKLNFLDRNVLILEYSVKECHQMIQSRHQVKKDCYIVDQGRPGLVQTLGRSIRYSHRIRFDYRFGFGNGDFTTRNGKVKLNQFYMVPQFNRTRSRTRFRIRLTFI